ncbi:MAG: NrfD/PsrC family molybdoenzyme membrane anchor subunit, partial [Dehalococcoidia bacterium]|nr:NrfD/PsrC family molybdoenzyme membrane anchor subunit [Dehalococcoidia bacterium]
PGFSFLPWTMHSGLIQGLAIASAVLLIAYTGFALGVVNSIPFWNTALMPLLFIIYSLLGGTGLTLGLLLGTGNTVINIEVVEAVARWFLLTAIVIVGAYLWISYHVNPVAKYSVFQLIKGRVSPYFIGGVLVLGLAVPVTVTALELVYNLPYTVMLSGVACELIGGFSLRYTILKAGAYTPLV